MRRKASPEADAVAFSSLLVCVRVNNEPLAMLVVCLFQEVNICRCYLVCTNVHCESCVGVFCRCTRRRNVV